MGSLSNLYISQSYQSLIHLATNNTASATLIDLQDGLGNSIGVSVNTGGDLYLSGSLTASLQQGYLYVGDANGKTHAFATASLVTNINTGSLVTTASFNSYTASNDSKVNQLIQATGSYATTGSNVFIGNQVIAGNISAISASFQYVTTIFETASVIYSSGSNQFGDELTDVQTLSGSVKVQGTLTLNGTNVLTASIPLTSLNDFTASQNQKNTTLENVTSSLQQFTSSANSRLNSLEAFTASVPALTSLNEYTASNDQKWSNLAGQSGSWVTSAITASSLVTASVNLNTITFTKGNGDTFNILVNTGSGGSTTDITSLNQFTQSIIGTNPWTASIDQKFATIGSQSGSWGGGGSINTGSFATTGSNTFTGQQTIDAPSRYGTSALNIVSASINFNGSGGRINFPNGAYFLGNPSDQMLFAIDGQSMLYQCIDSSPTATQRNILFQNTSPNGEIRFQTTGSFTNLALATNTTTIGRLLKLNDWTGNANTQIINHSGSIALTPSGFNATTASLSHISSSSSTQFVNLMFKNSNTQADTIISGSNNIFTNPLAATAGFKRYIGGNNNSYLPGNLPQISGSMAFSPAMAANTMVGASSITMRGPVSSSAWTISNNILVQALNIGTTAANNAEKIAAGLGANGNLLGGAINVIANKTQLQSNLAISQNVSALGSTTLNANSSSISYNTNFGNATINNNFQNTASLASANNSAIIQTNFFNGATLNFSGNDGGGPNNPKQALGNFIFTPLIYSNNSSSIDLSLPGSGSALLWTFAHGSGLILTGSSIADSNNGLATGAGSMFSGRFNATDGNRAKTAETILAIGTGTSYSNRKTGFLIDSGSNTFVEGTFNVSGSSTFTGSVIISSSAQYDLTVIDGMQVSGSTGRVTIGTSGFVTTTPSTNVGSYVNVYSIAQSNATTGDEFGITLDTDAYGISGWSGPAIYGNDPSDLYPAYIGFQNKSTYTDGKVTVLKPLVVSGSLTIPSGSGDLYVYGHKQFNCGGFQTNITQSGSANVSQSVNFEITDVSYGVTIASNSRITMANAGVYSITFSAQLLADAGADTIRMWLKKNGTNVPESTTKLALRNNEEAVMTVNFIVEAAAADYYEIVWQSANGDAVLLAENASGNYPAIPAVIVTAVQVR